MGDEVTDEDASDESLFQERIVGLACSKQHSMVLTKSGKLFACGDGEYGVLGNGGTTSSPSFTEVEFFANGGARHESVLSPFGEETTTSGAAKSAAEIKAEAERLENEQAGGADSSGGMG